MSHNRRLPAQRRRRPTRGVVAAQDRGVRVTLIGIPDPSSHNQSRELQQEVDDKLTIEESIVRRFLTQAQPTSPATENRTCNSPFEAGRVFGATWLRENEEGLNTLQADRPRIPAELDRALLRHAEQALGRSLQTEQPSREDLRAGFWSAIPNP